MPAVRPDAAESCHCVLLAQRNHELREGVRGLLGAVFEAVVMVADEVSLLECAERLRPTVAVVELSLAPCVMGGWWLTRLRSLCPELKIIVLSAYDQPVVREWAAEAGVIFILNRAIATDLLPAIDRVLAESPRPGGEPTPP